MKLFITMNMTTAGIQVEHDNKPFNFFVRGYKQRKVLIFVSNTLNLCFLFLIFPLLIPLLPRPIWR